MEQADSTGGLLSMPVELVDEEDGFEMYHVETTPTPALFRVLVAFAVVFSIALVAPMACWCWRRAQTTAQQKNQNNISTTLEMDPDTTTEEGRGASVMTPPRRCQQQQQQQTEERHNLPPPPPNISDLTVFHREHLAAMKVMSREYAIQNGALLGIVLEESLPVKMLPHSFPESALRRHVVAGSDRAPSAVPSVASTSRLYGGKRQRSSSRIRLSPRIPWGRHGRTHPLSRAQWVQQGVELERQSHVSGGDAGASLSHNSRSRSSWGAGGDAGLLFRTRTVSGAAGSVLVGESVEGEAEFYRQRYRQRSSAMSRQHQHQQNNYRGNRLTISTGGPASEVGSLMPPLDPDCVSPEDAADANDPGRPSYVFHNNSTSFDQHHMYPTTTSSLSSSGEPSNLWQALFWNLLDVAEIEYESKRILKLAAPSTLRAMADPIFRIILVIIISHSIDTDSMVAYLIVILFIRLTTEEVSGAIADTESNLLQNALLQGGDNAFFQAGQLMQLAIFVQLVVSIPILLLWYFAMDNVARWLVDGDAEISAIASAYTGVIIIDYVLRGTSRTFLLPFYLTGQAQLFEANIDVVATLLTLGAMAVVATTNELSLVAIGWIQVIIGAAKLIIKVAYVVLRGWLQPYKQGLLQTAAFRNPQALSGFLLQALPLFLGSLLELGEWEVLILFVRHLGGAEVATWAMMGVVWEIFLAFTEGLGEAASVRVSFFLSEGLPVEAKRLAYKVIFLSVVMVLVVTSLFLMAGPGIAVALSVDSALQHLFYQLVGMAGLANISMTMAQMYWSLAGAQGRYSVASATILFCRWLLVLPVASICVYRYGYDLVAVAGSIALGYAVAAAVLAWYVFRSDWHAIARSMQEEEEQGQCSDMNPTQVIQQVGDDMALYDVEDEDNEDEDSSEEDDEDSDYSSSYHSSSSSEEEKEDDIEEEDDENYDDDDDEQEAVPSTKEGETSLLS